jgi:endo-1,4-beta-xylanase
LLLLCNILAEIRDYTTAFLNYLPKTRLSSDIYTLSAEERDQRVGEIVTDYLDVALAQPAVEGVITWGLSDRRSWLYVTLEDYARHAGAWKAGEGPGLNRALPLDASMQRKPMYHAISAAFRRAPSQ